MSPVGPRPPRAPLVAGALLAAVACAGEAPPARKAAGAPQCGEPRVAAVAPAVLRFVELAKPTPQRFLVPVGTDSAMPDAGVRALQRKGPTYFYPSDPEQRARVRARMAEVGEYASLLVVLEEARRAGEGQALVRLGGVYVGGAHDGRPSPSRTIYLACRDSLGWTVRRAAEELSA